MKDFNYYINRATAYDVKLVSQRITRDLCAVTLETALRNAYNISRAHRTETKVLIRPVKCDNVLFIRAFTIAPDGLLHDDIQGVTLDYIKQDGYTHGCDRWTIKLTGK